MRKILFFIMALFASLTSYAQDKGPLKAEKAYNNKEYSKAIELYKKYYGNEVYDDKSEQGRLKGIIYITHIAECYRMLGDAKEEIKWDNIAIKAGCTDSTMFLYLAEAQKTLKYYDDAVNSYQEYLKKAPNDKKAMTEMQECQDALKK